MKVLNATEWHTLKWLDISYVTITSIFYRKNISARKTRVFVLYVCDYIRSTYISSCRLESTKFEKASAFYIWFPDSKPWNRPCAKLWGEQYTPSHFCTARVFKWIKIKNKQPLFMSLVSPCSKYFTWINFLSSEHPHEAGRYCYWGNQGPERLNNLPRVT